MKDPKSYDHYAWFFTAPFVFIGVLVLSYPMTTPMMALAGLINATVLASIFLVNGFRKKAGKKTYFWRMFAVYLTLVFAVYVVSSM